MRQTDKFEIMIFVETEVLKGLIFISTPEGRLLDELNGRSQMEPENRDKFIMINDVDIWHMDGKEEKTSVAHINKENIEMSGTTTINTGRGIGASTGPKPYPFTDKLPVKVRIEMNGYTIIGDMYRISHQQVEHVLKERSAFLPLTNAEVISTKYDKQWSLSFLAVNKWKMLSLHEQRTV
jgi:hypothetical protein